MKFLTNIFRKKEKYDDALFDGHSRLTLGDVPEVIYAIGDIHGELELLLELERKIIEDAYGIKGEKWIVYIGDLVDRGPKSAQVIDHLLKGPPEGFTRYCLLGNHEYYMLAAGRGELPVETWMSYGGRETLMSYYGGGLPFDFLNGRKKNKQQLEFMESIIPQTHIDFLSTLTLSITIPGYFFVHAGIRPQIGLDDQQPMDLLTIRGGFVDKDIDCGAIVVHGHTIVDEAVFERGKVSIDTGAYATRILTAARIEQNLQPTFIDTRIVGQI